jgi:hypothetical protein
MAALSEWLQLMLEEIARKREAQQRGHAEDQRRAAEVPPPPAAPTRHKRELE